MYQLCFSQKLAFGVFGWRRETSPTAMISDGIQHVTIHPHGKCTSSPVQCVHVTPSLLFHHHKDCRAGPSLRIEFHLWGVFARSNL